MAISYQNMDKQEIDTFLQTPLFAVIGTNRRDGPPQLTPVWFLYEKGLCYISVHKESAKYRNLRRDPRLCVCISGNSPDSRAVIFTGKAEIVQSHDEAWLKDIEWRLTRRYCQTDEEARAFLDLESGSDSSVIISLSPETTLAQNYN